jgi:hypothetical protein
MSVEQEGPACAACAHDQAHERARVRASRLGASGRGAVNRRLAPTVSPSVSNLDRPKAWRPGLAVRRWAGPVAASEHPAVMWLCLPPCGSSFRSADADRFLANQCRSFDQCTRAWGQSQRPYRRCCRDRRVRHQRPKRLRQSLRGYLAL